MEPSKPSGLPGLGVRRSRRPWILLAEDEPAARDVLTRALERSGYVVSAVPDGATALDEIENHPPEEGTLTLLVTDIVMPEMSGYELAEQAARRSPGIRIVFMTGYRDLPPPVGASILYKPFSLEALLTLAREHLGPAQGEH